MMVYAVGLAPAMRVQRTGARGAVNPVGSLKPVAGNTDTRRDTVVLSPAAKGMQMLQRLAENRDSIIEQKNALIAKTLEEGREMKAIEGQLESYDEQLLAVDEMMSNVLSAQRQDALEDATGTAEKAEKADPAAALQTEQEAQTQQVAGLSATAASFESAKTVAGTAARAQRQANVLASEIELDGGHNHIRQAAPGDNAANRQYALDKKAKLNGLRAKVADAYRMSAGYASEARNLIYTGGAQNASPAQESARAARGQSESEEQRQTQVEGAVQAQTQAARQYAAPAALLGMMA